MRVNQLRKIDMHHFDIYQLLFAKLATSVANNRGALRGIHGLYTLVTAPCLK